VNSCEALLDGDEENIYKKYQQNSTIPEQFKHTVRVNQHGFVKKLSRRATEGN